MSTMTGGPAAADSAPRRESTAADVRMAAATAALAPASHARRLIGLGAMTGAPPIADDKGDVHQRSSRARSRADCQRSSGFFSRQVRMMSHSLGGSDARAGVKGVGSRSRIAAISDAGVDPSKARLPVIISYSTQPK